MTPQYPAQGRCREAFGLMLETVDLSLKLSKQEYREAFEPLSIRLAELQREARAAGVPVIVVFEGWQASGKGTCINRLTNVLDARGFKVHYTIEPNEEERLRPWMWRFWTKLPPRGAIAIFDHSWYRRVLLERLDGTVSEDERRRAYDEILQFERQLIQDGAVIVKFWMHISKKEQKRRFKRLEKDPALEWRITKTDWRRHNRYDDLLAAVEEMLQRTSTAQAPWTVVEATNKRFARVKVAETIIAACEQGLQRAAIQNEAPAVEPVEPPDRSNPLSRVDLSLHLERDEYQQQLNELQDRLFHLEHEIYTARVPVVIVYEGWDAAGKGGSIRRLTRGLDPRGYEVVPYGAPTAEEKQYHYLWRFWRNLPKAGHITIFDRSWYGRVMVERVEGFCSAAEWQRAYQEINEFEAQLAAFGTVIVKFWLHISKDEQLRRFEERQAVEYKRWKITDEDWRNREKWDQYERAVSDMIQRTSTVYAPWTIVEGNCKLYARVKALRTIADAVEAALKHAS